MNRSLKTLHLRMKEHQMNAIAVAKFLESDARVEKVLYPGMFITMSSALVEMCLIRSNNRLEYSIYWLFYGIG